MKNGDNVRILINAGLTSKDNDTRYVGVAERGTVGVYIGRHPSKRLKHWHLIAVGELVAPLGEGQFEPL